MPPNLQSGGGLVAGILGWTCCLPGSIGAVVTGHLARARIRREPASRYDGDGFATPA
jgi:hypothetical protein